MLHPINTSPQSINPTISDRSNTDSSSTNGGMNYSNSSTIEHPQSSLRPFNSTLTGRSHSPATAQSHYSYNHPPSSSHPNPLQSSALTGNFSQIPNGNDNNSHSSYSNNSNHIASKNQII
jgi:hypothetical protein